MRQNKGFTLIELLVVVAIIGILAAISIPTYMGQQKRAARTEAYQNLEALRLFEEQYFAENACYSPAANCAAATYVTLATIQAFLPGFQPGQNPSFTYNLRTEQALTVPVAFPYVAGAGIVGQTNCFVASAVGIAGTRVAGDGFAIDCNNTKNF